MRPNKLPSLEYLKECFYYDEFSGKLFWKKRPRSHFATENAYSVWTSRCSGKEALYVASDGYGIVRLDGINRKVHRICWKLKTGEEPPHNIDHKDRNKINNRWLNMREADFFQNNINKILRGTPRSGHRGVYLAGKNKFKSFISTPAGNIYFGPFSSIDEALKARKVALDSRYGEFAACA